MPDLSPDTIATAATEPASASQDGRSADAVPIPDQIAADKYKRQSDALGTGNQSGWRGLRMARARGSSTVE